MQLSNKFIVNIDDKHFKIGCSAIENTPANQASRVAIELCRLLKKIQHIRPKKVVLFPEIGRVKKILSLTRPHSQICIRIYIFLFQRTSSKQTNKKQETKKTKETKEEKRISPEKQLKRIAAALVTRISGSKSNFFFFWPKVSHEFD